MAQKPNLPAQRDLGAEAWMMSSMMISALACVHGVGEALREVALGSINDHEAGTSMRFALQNVIDRTAVLAK